MRRSLVSFDSVREATWLSDEVASIEGLSPARVVMLGKTGIKSLDDLADLASDELREIVGEGEMSIDEADAVIMAARAHWFDDDFGGKGIGQVDIDKSGGNSPADAVEGGMLADDKSVEAAVIGGDDANSNAPEAEADDASGAVD